MPPIPTNLITGFLGVGKTTAVIDLLKHKTTGERWAVLVNEYGDVSIDGAMIEGSSPDGVTVREVGGGCVCCASAPYLPVALHFLLLDAKPDRLIIETTGLGHPARLLDTLRTNYADRLDVRAVLGIVDPADFAKLEMRDNIVFIDQIQIADVVVMNKLDTATPELVADFQKWANGLFPPKLLIAGTTYGRLDTAWLDLTANDERLPLYPEAHGHSPSPPNPLSLGERGRTLPSPPNPLSLGERGSECEESESAMGTHHASFSPSPPGRGGWGVRADFSGEDESQRLSELAARDRHIPELLLQRARELRREQTTAEQFLWDCLRDRQLSNSKFRRQHNVGPYIADFYCHSARLCIELDGGVHDIPDQQEKDRVRDHWMRENGFAVLRFRNEQVLEEPVTALQRIVDALTPPPPFQTALTPQPPLPAGEGEIEAKCVPTTHSSSLPLSPRERGLGGEGGLKPGHPVRYPSPPGVHPACCGWLFTPDDVFDEGKLLGLLGRSQGITRLKGVFRLTDEWAIVNRAGTAVSVAPTAYRRDSRLEVFAEGLDWLTFEQGLLDCLVIR
ncbi:MAG TPA: GTP-binding protein [Gemmata sp.]|jgi:G3E family GTPase|nr:GTP-binding protein [Gemmata sp.]